MIRSRTGPLALVLAVLTGALGLHGPVVADDSDLCLLAARDASQINAIPTSVLVAITLTETGRDQGAGVRPWPWTVNLEGEGFWFPDRASAVAFAEEQVAAGRTSFDTGCFQINYRWHGENFVSVNQMFDPMANATYAAGFLIDLHDETGDWSAAAGTYHSRTTRHSDRYRAIFDDYRADAIAAGVDNGILPTLATVAEAGPPDGGLPRTNSFPLLQQGFGSGGLGSLVPLGGG